MRIDSSILAVAAFALGSPAIAADIIDVTAAPYGAGGQGGGIRVGSLNFANFGPTGRFDVVGTNVTKMAAFSALTFCIDVTKPLFTGAPDNRFTLQSIAAFSPNTTKQAQIAALLLNTQSLIDGALNPTDRNFAAVATGLAVWEIAYESATTGYSISGVDGASGDGNFSIYGDFSPYQSLSNQYLANVESGTWTGSASRIRTLVSATGNAQNQLFIAPVPEPATWTMMIVGFGAIGSTMRRRQTKAALS